MQISYAAIFLAKEENRSLANQIHASLHTRDCESVIFTSFENFDEWDKVDLLISLGGDGTILRCVREMASKNIPVMGVNCGTLGFLAACEKADIFGTLAQLFEGHCTVHERRLLQARIFQNSKETQTYVAFNDCILRSSAARTLLTQAVWNQTEIPPYYGDGVIVSTPTGSTAYSLSAGGPVVEPTAQAMVVCPICIHNMRFSSYVLSPEHVLTVELERNGRKPVYLCVDESRAFALRSDDQVQVRRSKHTIRLVKLSEKSFCEVFAQKMLPGGFNHEK